MHLIFDRDRGIAVPRTFCGARRGELTQFVKFTDRAWHAGSRTYNGRSAATISPSVWSSKVDTLGNEAAQYETLANVVAALL